MEMSRRALLASGLASGVAVPFRLSSVLAAAPTEQFVTASISIEDRRIWAAVSLNGLKPELFFLDTGAISSAISQSYADANNLRTRGQTNISGLGGREQAEIVTAKNLVIGGALKKGEQDFVAVKSFDRANMIGTLGTEFLTFADSDLDFKNSQWRVYPGGRKDRTGLYQIPDSFGLRGRVDILQTQAKVGDFVGKFLIDTGSPGALLLDGAAAEKSGIWASQQPYAPASTRGFGGRSTRTRVYRQDRLKLYKFVLEDQYVRLMQPGNVRGQFDKYDGLIGMGALRFFDVSIDTKSKAMWLAPNGMTFADQVEYPMSGIWIDGEGNNISIAEIGIGSPAEKAGLKVGDKILGKDFRGFVAEINGKAGRFIAFDYERAGKRARAEFILQPYL